MAPPSLTSITIASPEKRTHPESRSLCSAVESPATLAPSRTDDLYVFRAPGPNDSRSPCPALNTLANHGYLPRDGHNISAAVLMAALENPRTYNASHPLAEVLARGGLALLLTTRKISLHEVGEHDVKYGLGVEHDASLVHQNTPDGGKYAPTLCDADLLNELLADEEFLTLDRIAKRRVELERISKLDPLHAEIARGEWALVLDIFGRAHGGKVPTDMMRVWLQENRFPDGWTPTHQQGLLDTRAKATALRKKMTEFCKIDELDGNQTAKTRRG